MEKYLNKRRNSITVGDLKYMKLNVIFLHISGCYLVESRWHIIFKFLYYIWRSFFLFCLSFIIIGSVLDMFTRPIEKIQDVALNVMNFLLFFGILIRSVYFIANLSAVKQLINQLNIEFVDASVLAFKEITMTSGKKNADLLFKIWMSFAIIACTLWIITPFIGSKERKLSMPIYTPYDWKISPYYEFTLIIQSISLIFMPIACANMELFNTSFMGLIVQGFKILKADFSDVINNALAKQGCTENEILFYNENEDFLTINRKEPILIKINTILESQKFKTDVHENLNKCILHHQRLLIFFNDYQSLISPLLFMELYSVFCYLIFMLFVCITTDDKALYLPVSQYLGGSIGQLYLISYFGEKLATMGVEMTTSFCNIPWYLCDKSFMVNFQIILRRMQRPLRATAGKVTPMSMEGFLEIMKKSFSFLAVLRQAND